MSQGLFFGQCMDLGCHVLKPKTAAKNNPMMVIEPSDTKEETLIRGQPRDRPLLNFIAVLLGGIPDRYLGDPRRHAEHLPDLFGR
jgi:hypothetical protein